ncbi:hypothetical protein J7438_20645 [Thalassotalea sp. G20_0]|uniref:hypothetical protein n=1 Tax=Thalassotalea sp. G20_0 TaxID=2821093 RepID=UPI001AD999BA|nr:hypothetical protein [Thalassotalea sp. G20_0]MBO9496470.1 hypothetical protein [Thalassotalea sp. G20_0]
MNPITAIKRYLADNPGNEPMNTLGLTADGRIVRLAEQEEGQRAALSKEFERQLRALMPREIGRKIRQRMIKKTLGTDVQTLGGYLERLWQDRQIRNRLLELETEYATELVKLDKLTSTHITPSGNANTEGKNQPGEPLAEYIFINKFTQRHWTFIDNAKTGAVNPKDFYMSNVIARQFKLSFDTTEWLLELPEIIERDSITNKKTIETLKQHQDDYSSDDFRTAFLETTDNGKSTDRVARDLGLIIGSITVTYKGQPVVRIADPIDIEQANKKFCVQLHVSPNPAVYGAP